MFPCYTQTRNPIINLNIIINKSLKRLFEKAEAIHFNTVVETKQNKTKKQWKSMAAAFQLFLKITFWCSIEEEKTSTGLE